MNATSEREGKLRKARSFALALTGAAIFAVAWHLLGVYAHFDLELFPPLRAILARVLSLAGDPEFFKVSLAPSLIRLVLAALSATPLAIFLGMLIGRSKTINAMFMPLINFIYPLPKVAIFPFILAIFGMSTTGKVVLIAVGMFFPLFLNVIGGIERLNKSGLKDVIAVYAPEPWLVNYQFYLRGLIPDILTGLKTSVGYGFTLVVVSEMTASQDGIGHFIWRAWDSFNLLNLHAGIFILCFVGWLAQTSLGRFRERG